VMGEELGRPRVSVVGHFLENGKTCTVAEIRFLINAILYWDYWTVKEVPVWERSRLQWTSYSKGSVLGITTFWELILVYAVSRGRIARNIELLSSHMN